jgi:radical SAM superfamily enzyme YgiQ (UPF0313 family)
MKILLVLPAAPHLRVTADNPRVSRRTMLRFSVLPLTTVAALTPPEHSVALCDENVHPLDFDTDADVVGVSFMTAVAPRAYEIAGEFRRRGKITVAGGYHPTFRPEEAAAHFDAVVVGDAEGLWPQVLADIEFGGGRGIYRHKILPDLAATPVPRRDLTAPWARHYATRHAVQTGRGCCHGCRFCSVTAFHRQTCRHRPLDHVLAELRALPRNFMFVDDNIIADPDYARALFAAMVPLRKRWVSQCSLRIADDPALLALARRAGCVGLFVGLESLSAANLDSVGKSINTERDSNERIRAIRRAGIGVQAAVIVGLDHDGVDVFGRTLRFLQAARVDALQLSILTPLPGTPLFDEFEAAGRIADPDWSHYDFRHVVIAPAGMTARDLQDGADWLYAQFYRLDRIVVRTLRGLWLAGPLPALFCWRLNLTYRYDNRREGIVGRNPGRGSSQDSVGRRWWVRRFLHPSHSVNQGVRP